MYTDTTGEDEICNSDFRVLFAFCTLANRLSRKLIRYSFFLLRSMNKSMIYFARKNLQKGINKTITGSGFFTAHFILLNFSRCKGCVFLFFFLDFAN